MSHRVLLPQGGQGGTHSPLPTLECSWLGSLIGVGYDSRNT